MTTMQERERGFEAKHAHDEEVRFRIGARRDKLFARMIAGAAQLSPDDADALMHEFVRIPDGPGHDAAVLELGSLTLEAAGVRLDPKLLAAELVQRGADARNDILGRSA